MSSPTWSSINQRMRSLDLKLKNENDSNRRCSFDKLMQVNGQLLMNEGEESAQEEGEHVPLPQSPEKEPIKLTQPSPLLPLIQTSSSQLPPLRPTNLPISQHVGLQPINTLHERNVKSAESAPAELLLPTNDATLLSAPIIRSADHTTPNIVFGQHKRTIPTLSTGNLGQLTGHRSNAPKSAELKSAPTPTSGGSLNFTLNQSIRSTYSSFIDRISARLNGSLNFASNRTQSFPITGGDSANVHTLSPNSQDSLDSTSPTTKNLSSPHRSSSAKMNGNERLDNSSNSPTNISPFPPSLNAQCLSPRPRLKALPISFANGRNRSPSRSSKPLQPLFSSPNPQASRFDSNGILQPKKDNNTTLRDKFRQNNNVLTINNQKYHCHERDFRYIEELGSGSCGHVAKMEHIPSKSIIAVKQMRRSGDDEESKRIIMDLDVLLKCHDCDNIVQCYGYLIKDAEVWIFMELMVTCLDKLLRKLKKPFPEKICGKIAVASVKALNYLKDNHSVIHRDVKPSNILINSKGVVKLCDFGISGRLVDSKARTRQAGCAAYMAPERIDPPDPTKPSYDIRADVWSLGISLVELAIGKFPYPECKTDFEVLSKILQADPPVLPEDGTYSSYFCSFIKDCLQKDYHKRPKYHQLMCHPFILKYEREEVDVEKWFLNSVS